MEEPSAPPPAVAQAMAFEPFPLAEAATASAVAADLADPAAADLAAETLAEPREAIASSTREPDAASASSAGKRAEKRRAEKAPAKPAKASEDHGASASDAKPPSAISRHDGGSPRVPVVVGAEFSGGGPAVSTTAEEGSIVAKEDHAPTTGDAAQTPASTSDACHTAVAGEHCHSQVRWAMQRGVLEHPEWYGNLTEDSTPEDFQAFLHASHPELGCSRPCAAARCETAVAGGECYDAVLWAAQVGTCTQPDWYPGLTRASTFEQFQKHLHLSPPSDGKPVCPMPCHGKSPVPKKQHDGPSLFCFEVANEDYEVDIVRYQHDHCAGIFGCDEAAVVSNSADVAGVRALTIEPVEVGVSQDGFAANTEVFLRAWGALRSDGRFAGFDWTVKADPDCVLVPDRLRRHLGDLGSGSLYVLNCNHEGMQEPALYGAVEAVSRLAAQAFVDGQERCRSELAWALQAWGEDKWLAKCLDLIGVQRADDYEMLRDQRCWGDANCADQAPAAFHPFKTADSWRLCWEQTASDQPAVAHV